VGTTREALGLQEARDGAQAWRKWGPCPSERQWGTVREDYSDSGDAWNYFTHDQARSRAYSWGEDGIAGISDDKQTPCQTDPHWRDHILFYEYFHGDNGAGLGARHQTGWIGLAARLIYEHGMLGAKSYLEIGTEAAARLARR
jgi:hypothetical protein